MADQRRKNEKKYFFEWKKRFQTTKCFFISKCPIPSSNDQLIGYLQNASIRILQK